MVSLPLHTPDDDDNSPGDRATSSAVGPEKTRRTSGVRYGVMNWIGEFRLPPRTAFQGGAKVVVQSDRGIELGEQVSLTCQDCDQAVSCDQIKRYIANSGPEFYRLNAGKVLREASPQDVDEHERLNAHICEDLQRCTETAAQLNLDMKVVTAEHLLGGERIVFYFRSEGRIDFRELVRELAQYYQTRIEMRQVGARDEARLIADYEVCGRECCCKNFLKKLRPITMRMAKLQKSTLDPSKVSGRCGRLRCCLRYEHAGYDELVRRLPRLGTRVQTEAGPATVTDRQVLTQLVLVRTDDDRELAIPVEELSPSDAPPVKPAVPEPVAPAPGPDADEPAPDEREDRSRRRPRRSRRRRKPPVADADELPPTTTPTRPASETPPPPPPETSQARDAPAADDGSSEGGARPPRRRRRRRRRPRHGQSDLPPGTDEG